ncbi:MAG: tRNA (N(6)-L-threonylcarbamoyladenosine(37)-C(2))-methylthiotransferase MtaB [Alphaproteobacteria bacterium]|nr:MAG: tRNA (N(6)-L-threonylcarbamoyladenosine(37)-C(2))-methylthiotransferase MtaB [Alphaproteobacteria bacterium]
MGTNVPQTQIKVVTFGCRLNTVESQVMASHAHAHKLEKTIIINTCAVTNEAERQAKQAIRKLNLEHPDHKIIVTGCAAQISPLTYGSLPGVTRVLGNHEKMLPESYASHGAGIDVGNIMEIKKNTYPLLASMTEGCTERSRAFVQIQNGCNHRCTFCTIPFGRGNNRSIPLAQLIRHVRERVDAGIKEVILTGVDITDYGSDLPGKPTLGMLVARMLRHIPDLPRLRLSSLDPVEVDEDLYGVLGQSQRIMPHFHISLQSGNDMILQRMKRRHARHHIVAFCARVRALRPDAVFGADIIAGFPTETDQQFADSLSIIEECDITHIHAFSFSPKAGTPAARMPQLDRRVIKDRTGQLRTLGASKLASYVYEKLRSGDSLRVLCEKRNQGYTEDYIKVSFREDVTPGELIIAKPYDISGNTLLVSHTGSRKV